MADEKNKPKAGTEPTPQPVPMFYSNAVRVSHQPYEFQMDFGMTTPENPQAVRIMSRAILSPQHMKALLKAIADNLKKYEQQFGKINYPQTGPGIDEILGEFGGRSP